MGVLKKFYIQRLVLDGNNTTNPGWTDIYATYNIVCQEFPFKFLPEIKEPAVREWPDENGEDVFFPSDGWKLKAYDLEVTFLYCDTDQNEAGDRFANMHTKIRNFIKFITGQDSDAMGMEISLSIYDKYTKMGFSNVYVKEISNEMYDYKDEQINALAKFKVKFRITNPTAGVSDPYPEN